VLSHHEKIWEIMTMKAVDDAGLPKEQLDLIEHFEADYNAVDRFLRKALGSDNQVSFTHLVNEYARKHNRLSCTPAPVGPVQLASAETSQSYERR